MRVGLGGYLGVSMRFGGFMVGSLGLGGKYRDLGGCWGAGLVRGDNWGSKYLAV